MPEQDRDGLSFRAIVLNALTFELHVISRQRIQIGVPEVSCKLAQLRCCWGIGWRQPKVDYANCIIFRPVHYSSRYILVDIGMAIDIESS